MPDERQQKERYAPVWGILLLFLGIIFLLQNLNVLPWGLWGTLWHFWPVLIIAIGLTILLRYHNVWLVSALILAMLFACLGITVWQYGASPPAEKITTAYSEPLGSLEQAQIEIDFSGGSLTMDSLPSRSLNFMEAGSGMRNGEKGMKAEFRRHGSEGELHLSLERGRWEFWSKGENSWQVRFNRNIPLTLDVKSTASSVNLDLSQLQLTELNMGVDLSNYTVNMPFTAGSVHVYINADLSNLEIIIPDGVAIKLVADADLSILKVDENRFPRKGDYYVSQDFASAKNRIEIELDCDLSRVQVK
ncbi:hypothetical protein ES708_03409 [subsurface metagenome]